MKFKIGQKIIDKIRGKKPKKEEEWRYTPKSHYGFKHIYTGESASKILQDELLKDKPSLICRFGSVELNTLREFMEKTQQNEIVFSDTIKNHMEYNAGFFPATDYMLSRFASELLEIVPNIDTIGVWFLPKEEEVLLNYAKNAKFIGLEDLNPTHTESSYAHPNGEKLSKIPYTSCLKGRKVLVISPFVKTIESQYKKRELLFENKETLPDFELKTIKAVQSLHDNVQNLPYKNWFEALDDMKNQISKTDFDIALIGCGAYGIFLADFVKKLGKKAIHMGGAVQLLFGIMGKRWETEYHIKSNEHWTRPSEDEIPLGSQKVEGGCYW